MAKTPPRGGGGAGIDGERSGMWREMARVVSEVRPQYVFVENSPMLVTRGLERVLGDLTKIGYDTKWLVMGAADVGAPHQRDRIWILGSDTSIKRCNIWGNNRKERQFLYDIDRISTEGESQWKRRISGIGQTCKDVAYTSKHRIQSESCETGKSPQWSYSSSIGDSRWWSIEPNVGRVAYGLADRVDRLKAIGNGQVPLCAATAWRILK